MRLVTAQLGVLFVVGLVIGIGLALAGAWFAGALLFGVSWHEPVAILESLALLSAIGAIAGAVPALRASRIRETSALRAE